MFLLFSLLSPPDLYPWPSWYQRRRPYRPGRSSISDPLVDAAEESQDVVDEFFAQANELAEKSGNDLVKRKEALKVYKDRRKNEKDDGVMNGLNNW